MVPLGMLPPIRALHCGYMNVQRTAGIVAALLLVAGLPCFSEDARRPACEKQNRGRLWPEQANNDHALARLAGQCGELQMCSRGTWKYGWQPLTVHISQLGKAQKQEIPGCAALSVKVSALHPSKDLIEHSEYQSSEREVGLQVSRP